MGALTTAAVPHGYAHCAEKLELASRPPVTRLTVHAKRYTKRYDAYTKLMLKNYQAGGDACDPRGSGGTSLRSIMIA